MPSLDVTLAFVAACGGDPGTWRDRWEQARRALAGESAPRSPGGTGAARPEPAEQLAAPAPASPQPAPPAAADPLPATAEPSLRQTPRRRGRRVVFAGLLTASVALNAVLLLAASSKHQPSPPPVVDGTDPVAEGCDDAVSLDVQPVRLHAAAFVDGHVHAAGSSVGTVTLRYSRHCAGAWARFDPGKGLFLDPNEADVTVSAGRPAEGAENTWRLGHLDQTYSDLLLTGMGCVVASATVTIYNGDVTADGSTHCLPKI